MVEIYSHVIYNLPSLSEEESPWPGIEPSNSVSRVERPVQPGGYITKVNLSSIYRTFCAVEQGKICTFPCRRGGEGAIELVGEGSREALL